MQPIRVVIVEDDPMVMEINAEFTEKLEGFIIAGKASSGSEALSLMKDSHPDLLLLDYFLPDINGLSLLKNIRIQNLPIDVILLTANRDPRHVQEILRAGAVDYIVKPFRYERFQASLLQYRKMKRKLAESQFLDQEELDILTGRNKREWNDLSEEELPKGLNDRTMQQVLQFLFEQDSPLSAEEVASGTGLARVTVRRYLEFLQRKGDVQIEVQYGSVGRPINRYKI